MNIERLERLRDFCIEKRDSGARLYMASWWSDMYRCGCIVGWAMHEGLFAKDGLRAGNDGHPQLGGERSLPGDVALCHFFGIPMAQANALFYMHRSFADSTREDLSDWNVAIANLNSVIEQGRIARRNEIISSLMELKSLQPEPSPQRRDSIFSRLLERV